MNKDLNIVTLYLRRIPFLRTLPESTLEAIARRMHKTTVPAGTRIFQAGDPGDAIYIVDSGEVEIATEDGIPIAVVYSGSALGEVEVLSELPRKVSAHALTDATLWVLHRTDLLSLAQEHPHLQQAMDRALGRQPGSSQAIQPTAEDLKAVSLFQGLTTDQLEKIASLLTTTYYQANTAIYTSGTPAQELYILAEGEVSIRERDGKQLLELYRVGPNDVFGVEEVLKQDIRQTEAFALTNVKCWNLAAEDLNALVEEMPRLALNLARIISDHLMQRHPVVVTAQQEQGDIPKVTVQKTVRPQARPGGIGAWFHRLDRSARLKLAALIVLIIWLVGVAMPLTLHRAMTQNKLYTQTTENLSNTVIGNSPAGIPLATGLEESYPTPTATPIPTPTPAPGQ